MNYTKGEWKISGNCIVARQGGYKIEIAKLTPFHQGEGEANACLISAAPDMYEACKLSLLLSEQPILQGNANVQMLTNTLKSALAKAEKEVRQ